MQRFQGWNREEMRRIGNEIASQPGASDSLLQKIQSGQLLSPPEDYALRRVISRMASQQLGDLDNVRRMSSLFEAYRGMRSQIADTLGSAYDETMTPEQRALWAVNELIYSPTKALADQLKRVQRVLDSSETSAEEKARARVKRRGLKQRQAKQAQQLVTELKNRGIDISTISDELSQQDNLVPRRIGENRPLRVKLAQAMRATAAAKNTGWNAAFQWYLNALFSGPGSQVANVVSNAAWNAWNMSVRRLASAVVNEGMYAIGKGDPLNARLHPDEIEYMIRGLLPGFVRASRALVDSYKYDLPMWSMEVTGEYMSKEDVKRLSSPYLKPESDIGKLAASFFNITAGAIQKCGLTSLTAWDEFQKSMRCEMEVGVLASRIARAEGLTGERKARRIRAFMEDLDSPAWKLAVQAATRDTLWPTTLGDQLVYGSYFGRYEVSKGTGKRT